MNVRDRGRMIVVGVKSREQDNIIQRVIVGRARVTSSYSIEGTYLLIRGANIRAPTSEEGFQMTR